MICGSNNYVIYPILTYPWKDKTRESNILHCFIPHFFAPSSSSLSPNKCEDIRPVSPWCADHDLGPCCWSSVLQFGGTWQHCYRKLQLHLVLALHQLCPDRLGVWRTPQRVAHRRQRQLQHYQGAGRTGSDWYVLGALWGVVLYVNPTRWNIYYWCALYSLYVKLHPPLSPVPCSPVNISVSVDCSQDSAKLNWTTRKGAIFYIAVAQDTSGNKRGCNSFGTNCLIEGLACGQNYTASVFGTNLKCNSTASEEVTFMTGRSEGWLTWLCQKRQKDLCTKLSYHASPLKHDSVTKSDLLYPHSLILLQHRVLQPASRHSGTVTPTMRW